MRTIFCLCICLLGHTTFARPIRCGNLDLRQVRVGTTCITYVGGFFSLVARDKTGEIWRGPDNLIWSDVLLNNTGQPLRIHTHAQGHDECSKREGWRLPRAQEFRNAAMSGFEEVLPNLREFQYITYSAIRATYIYEGTSGVTKIHASATAEGYAVRCVRQGWD